MLQLAIRGYTERLGKRAPGVWEVCAGAQATHTTQDHNLSILKRSSRILVSEFIAFVVRGEKHRTPRVKHCF